MSWDILIFSSKQKISFIEEADEEQFIPISFNTILKKHFDDIIVDGDHREIKGKGYTINYFVDTMPAGNLLFNLYGETALFELIRISKIYGWQIYDTGTGQMIYLDKPEKNGYENFQNFLLNVIKNSTDQI